MESLLFECVGEDEKVNFEEPCTEMSAFNDDPYEDSEPPESENMLSDDGYEGAAEDLERPYYSHAAYSSLARVAAQSAAAESVKDPKL